MDKGRGVAVIFLDFSEVFGTIPHSILLDKLSNCVIIRFMLHWMMNWLNDGATYMFQLVPLPLVLSVTTTFALLLQILVHTDKMPSEPSLCQGEELHLFQPFHT